MPRLIIEKWPENLRQYQQVVRHVQGVMLYPSDGQRRKEFQAAELMRTVAHAEASGPRQTAEALLVALQEPGFFSTLSRRLFRQGSYDDRGQSTIYGAMAGDILLYVYVLEKQGYEGSVNRAIYLLQQVYAESTTLAGRRIPTNKKTFRDAWSNYQSVAHFWGALRVRDMGFFHGEACAQEAVALQTLSPAQLQAYSYYIWQKFPVFMARAHHLLQFGMTYTRIHGEKRPLLPPDKVWRCVSPPDLPAVEFPVPRLTDLDKQRLATYSQLFRHKE